MQIDKFSVYMCDDRFSFGRLGRDADSKAVGYGETATIRLNAGRFVARCMVESPGQTVVFVDVTETSTKRVVRVEPKVYPPDDYYRCEPQGRG